MGKVLSFFFLFCLVSTLKASSQQRLSPSADTVQSPFSLKVLPQNFYNRHLSFFCKKEVQLQKLTSLPIYFRVGSKDYVDYLEKKPNAVLYRQ
jgi:hypothetical protein